MERSPFLPLPDGLALGPVGIGEAQLTAAVISTQPYARCPGCGTLSKAPRSATQRKPDHWPI
jgi:hypothetical protein